LDVDWCSRDDESSVTATVRDLPPTSAIEKTAKSISSTWPKSGRLGGSSRPTAPSESSRFRPSKIDLRRNRQNHHRREADVEVSTAHPGASRTETIRRIGGPSKCGRKRSSSTWPIIGSTRGSSRPTVPYHIQPKIDLHQNRFGPDQPTWPEAGGRQMRAKNRKKSTQSVGGNAAHRLGRKSARPVGAVGLLLPAKIDQNRLAPKSTRASTANPRLRHWTSPVAPQRPRTVPTGRPPGRRPAQPRPIAGSKQVDGNATVHGRHRPAAMSTEVAAAKPGLRHWTPPVAPWRLSTPPTGGCQARRPAQPRPGLHQPRRQPGKP